MILSTENASKVYKPDTSFAVRAVTEATLGIPRGAVTVIRGPSGSGKTTLLCMLGTLLRPTSGRVLLEGRDLSLAGDAELTRLRRDRIGFVFQGFHLVCGLRAWQNVSLPLVPRELSESARKKRAVALLERLGLSRRAEHRPEELSGGEQQRVAIARALVAGPDIVLADEPTSNIDEASIETLHAMVTALRKDGTTVVIVSHDPRVRSWADQVLELSGGRVQAS